VTALASRTRAATDVPPSGQACPRLFFVVAALLFAGDGRAQDVVPGPPGPYVFDVRGTTMGVPQAFGFYPEVPLDILVPARGFGVEAGGHVYFGRLGPARLGLGAAFVQVRGTAGDSVTVTTRVLAPQLSFNFGTSRGWSYLSGGIGMAQVRGRFVAEADGTGERSRGSGPFAAINAGGGARWFIRPRVAFTVDLRAHRLAARAGGSGIPPTPSAFLAAASAGLSFR
jgi:hypothetical protein